MVMLRCIANYMGWSFVRKVDVCMSKQVGDLCFALEGWC